MFYQKTLKTVAYFVFRELEEIPGFLHAFGTRRGQPSQAPVAPESLSRAQTELMQALVLSMGGAILLRQVHSDRVVEADSSEAQAEVPRVLGPADAVVTTAPGQFPILMTADCLPILMVLPGSRRVCSVHAGRRGTSSRITLKALRSFLTSTGSTAGEIVAAIGPCIRRCCYEVGPEVLAEYEAAGHDLASIAQGRKLDLVEANRLQLEQAGVKRILDSGMCTRCRTDLFFSYRGEGAGTGRNLTIAGFKPVARLTG